MGRTLEPIEIQILKKCEQACIDALEGATPEVSQDMRERIIDLAIDDYYNDYKPTKYKRTESLYNAFSPKIKMLGNKTSKVSIGYDWHRLPQYMSKSKLHKGGDDWISRNDSDFFDFNSSENGIVERGWVLTNFFEGIHPKYHIDRETGMVVDNSEYFTPSYIRIRDYKNIYERSGRPKQILRKHLSKQAQRYLKMR